jgi:hypothetical protein
MKCDVWYSLCSDKVNLMDKGFFGFYNRIHGYFTTVVHHTSVSMKPVSNVGRFALSQRPVPFPLLGAGFIGVRRVVNGLN